MDRVDPLIFVALINSVVQGRMEEKASNGP